MKKLVADKLPRLNAHLQEYFVDVTLVTFSWFLTLFTDALPTEVSFHVYNIAGMGLSRSPICGLSSEDLYIVLLMCITVC